MSEYEKMLKELGCKIEQVTLTRISAPSGMVLMEGANREEVIATTGLALRRIYEHKVGMPTPQQRALSLLTASPSREIYIGTDGAYYITSTGDESAPQLKEAEVLEMFEAGLIVRKYSDYRDCYALPGHEWRGRSPRRKS